MAKKKTKVAIAYTQPRMMIFPDSEGDACFSTIVLYLEFRSNVNINKPAIIKKERKQSNRWVVNNGPVLKSFNVLEILNTVKIDRKKMLSILGWVYIL